MVELRDSQKLVWVEALGVTVAIDVMQAGEELTSAIREAWRDAQIVPVPGRAPDVTVAVREGPIDHVLSSLSQRVTLAAIEACRGRRWMLHAAGLATSGGAVVALVGPSGRGKTTAATILGRSFGYVSDETVSVDRYGSVYPYRKPLSIIGCIDAPKMQKPPSALGLHALAPGPLRLAAIVLLDRRSDWAGAPYAEDVPLSAALEELVSQSSHLAALGTPLQWMSRQVEAIGGVKRAVYREASQLPDLIREILLPARAPNNIASSPVRWESSQEPRSGLAYFRAPFREALELSDGALAVFSENEYGRDIVHVIGGVGPTLLAAASGATFDELVARTVAVHGHAPAGNDDILARAALEELIEDGLVQSREARWGIRGDVAWVGSANDARFTVMSLARDDESPHELHASAAVVWGALAEGDATLTEVIGRVANAVGVPREAIAEDMTVFLDELSRRSFVELR